MKKVVAFFFIFLFFLKVNAQDEKPTLSGPDLKRTPTPSKFYHKVFLGYAFKSGLGTETQKVDQTNGGSLENRIPFSYGKGFNLGYGFGYMFHQNVGVELSASYLFGGITEIKNTFIVTNVSYPYTDKQTVDENASMFRLNPSLIFSATGNKIIPYGKIGLIMGWGSSKSDVEETVTYNSGGTGTGSWKYEYKGFSGIGYLTSAGIRIKGDMFCDIILELTHISLGAGAKKGSMTSSEINGKSNLSSLTTSQKEYVYVDQIDTGATQDPNQPTKYLAHKSSFDSFGFNVGIIFKIYK